MSRATDVYGTMAALGAVCVIVGWLAAALGVETGKFVRMFGWCLVVLAAILWLGEAMHA